MEQEHLFSKPWTVPLKGYPLTAEGKKSKLNINNKQELEEYFAENFDSILFPVLSECYLIEGDLDRAERVCDIGLRFNGNSLLGLFLKTRVLMGNKDFNSAELCLKKIISIDPGFLNALLLMLEVQSILKRPKVIIKQYCDEILALDPENFQARQVLNKLTEQQHKKPTTSQKLNDPKKRRGSTKKLSTQNRLKTKVGRSENAKKKNSGTSKRRLKKKPESKNKTGLNEFSTFPKLATFTLVRVLKTQKLYDQALEVLSIMAKKQGVNKKKVAHEKKLIITQLKADGAI